MQPPSKKKKTASKKAPPKESSSQKATTTPSQKVTTDSEKPINKSSDEQTTADQALLSEINDSKASRKHNYRDDEDVQICKSWLEVSQDPLNSTNQASDTFWTRVEEHYTSVKIDSSRSWSSIKSRWQILQHAVNKFCGCVKQVDLANKSGTTVEDRFLCAMKLYQAISVTGKKMKKPKKPSKFTHMACYHVLSKAEKWKQLCEELNCKKKEEDFKKKEQSEIPTPSTPSADSRTGATLSSDAPIDDATSDTSTVRSNQTVCAMGNKKAKDLAAKLREDKKFKDDLLAVHCDLAKQTKSQNNIFADQQEALTTLADNSIMQTDLAKVSETSRPFYEWQQMKVLDKIKREQDEYKKQKELKEAKEQKAKEEAEKRLRREAKRTQEKERNRETREEEEEMGEEEGEEEGIVGDGDDGDDDDDEEDF
ncbi:hypothetical protein PSTG_10934 [Puccinia striiformis f. sp. tritici PST-78]|uniref:No apical meristem-associated C-terminal domain-containing protein n=1 Tax=Puccinia striiformis f. sp. tritici PST-78 TaxID=1165861 RepID=A0A0L0V943_9BASI|nr:hypothetical protein PSTG_10934 [Puccinia striiformis f. sp. tritici PST-78]